MKTSRSRVPFVMALFILIYPIRGGDTLGLGTTPTLLVLTLLVGAFAIRSKPRFVPVATDYVVFCYFILCVLGIIISGVSDLSLSYFLQIFMLSILPYGLIRVYGFSMDEAKRLVSIFPAFTIAAAASMVAIVGPTNILGYSGFRLGTEALNPVGVGYTFGLAALLSVFAIKLRLGNIAIAILAACVSIAILMLTASRASILGVGLVLIAMFVSRQSFNWRTVVGMCALITAAYFVFGTLAEKMVIDRFINFQQSASANERVSSWSQALQMFDTRPLVGHGLASFEVQHGQYAHNVVLEHMANGGLLLTVPFVICCLVLLSILAKNALRKSGQIIFVLALLGIYSFFVRQFSLSMANTKEVFLFLALAICCNQEFRRTLKRAERKGAQTSQFFTDLPVELIDQTVLSPKLK